MSERFRPAHTNINLRTERSSILEPEIKIVPNWAEISPPTAQTPSPELSPQLQTKVNLPQYTASFTQPISEALKRCNIATEFINPVPLGQGSNHLVYLYTVPNEPVRVIKMAKAKSPTTLTHDGGKGAEEGIEIAQKAFGSYAAEAEVRIDPQDAERYFVIQDLVKGKPITNIRVKQNPKLQKQLADIVRRNNMLYKQDKMSLDFIGMPGFLGWFKSQFKKLLLHKSEFEVSNIIEDESGNLKIIDFEYFRLADHVGLKQRFFNFIGMQTNRILMKHYFGLDIKED